jgi:hypothetical protein
LRKDGSLILVDIGLTPVATASGPAVICAIVDLTRRKEADQEIAVAAEDLRRANAALLELATADPLTGLANRRALRSASRPAADCRSPGATALGCDDGRGPVQRV